MRATRDPAGLVGVGADDQRGAGVDSGGRLGGGPAGDGDPSLGDQGHGVLTRSGQAPPHELRVESTAADHQSYRMHKAGFGPTVMRHTKEGRGRPVAPTSASR